MQYPGTEVLNQLLNGLGWAENQLLNVWVHECIMYNYDVWAAVPYFVKIGDTPAYLMMKYFTMSIA